MSKPSRSDVHARLIQLLRGDVRREEIATWANQWLALDEPSVSDRAVMEALKHLAGADLKVGPDEYLHGEEDIHAWLDELENAGG